MVCTRCEATGFLNLHQLTEEQLKELHSIGPELFLVKHTNLISNKENDVQVCDCCGDGSYWYGIAGEHYNQEDPRGINGPYNHNGGLCECH